MTDQSLSTAQSQKRQIGIKLTPDQYAAIERSAARQGITVTKAAHDIVVANLPAEVGEE